MSLMNAHITLLCDTPHNNTTGNYRYFKCNHIYYVKNYILIHFEIQKKLIVVSISVGWF
jgi:hypothetical protein